MNNNDESWSYSRPTYLLTNVITANINVIKLTYFLPALLNNPPPPGQAYIVLSIYLLLATLQSVRSVSLYYCPACFGTHGFALNSGCYFNQLKVGLLKV